MLLGRRLRPAGRVGPADPRQSEPPDVPAGRTATSAPRIAGDELHGRRRAGGEPSRRPLVRAARPERRSRDLPARHLRADESYRFIGSIAMDQNGDMALGYSKSDATIHPTWRDGPPGRGRARDDGAENVLRGPEQPGPVCLLGHYGSMAWTRSDDCTSGSRGCTSGPLAVLRVQPGGLLQVPELHERAHGRLEGTVTEALGPSHRGARVTAGASETRRTPPATTSSSRFPSGATT